MRIGFFGDGKWASEAIKGLVNLPGIELAFLALRKLQSDPELAELGEELNLKVLTPEKVNAPENIEFIKQANCDLLVSMSYDQYFGSTIRNLTPLGIINCHAGKLPFYRGRNVLTWALINDESEFGITCHFVDEGIDTGDIILQKTYPISDLDDYSTLIEQAVMGCSDVLLESIKLLDSGEYTRLRQRDIHEYGFYCSRRLPGDEKINWNQSSRQIFTFVRALASPGPIARTSIGSSELLVEKAEYLPSAPSYQGIPGSIVGFGSSGPFVKTSDSFVYLVGLKSSIRLNIGDRFQ